MGFLKYIDRPFYWCQKIVKKWWLSQSYLELKKAKIPRETKSCAISYHLKKSTYSNVIGMKLWFSKST